MERVVLITGCSSGIGRATAEAFLREEWTVMATARRELDLKDLQKQGCATATLDVTDAEQIEKVVQEILDRWGRLDCLVNNAGYSQIGPVEDIPVELLHDQFDVNVYGPHRLVRQVLPHMRERENGTIVNVSSGLGRISIPGAGVYSASKFALEAMSDALRAEVDSLGIDVVLVEPGNVDTEFSRRASYALGQLDRTDSYEPLYRLLDDWISVDGFGSADLDAIDVADAIVNAASATQPDARYVVGTTGRLASLARFAPEGIRDTIYGIILRATSVRRNK